ncbi:uncharacterized protein LOC106760739 [Vigna radiata var. radiata]|uniref:Uncharacterized protein LOC106760739 n=1 Tax=Vigna radiata var. radiata TaxID=3916 RepID=A0A1S3U0T9_VIGRR|nr:uncharacterized protein LOC106760739 [Vigna radiata var. radiata]
MFRDARIAGERTYWIGDDIWTTLLEHWNSPQYQAKCAIAQKNRASEKGGVLHTGGSITVHAMHMEEFSTKLSRVRSSHSSCSQSTQQPDDDEDLIRSQCWIDVVGGKKKGRIYGAGQMASNYTAGRGGLKHQPSSSF